MSPCFIHHTHTHTHSSGCVMYTIVRWLSQRYLPVHRLRVMNLTSTNDKLGTNTTD